MTLYDDTRRKILNQRDQSLNHHLSRLSLYLCSPCFKLLTLSYPNSPLFIRFVFGDKAEISIITSIKTWPQRPQDLQIQCTPRFACYLSFVRLMCIPRSDFESSSFNHISVQRSGHCYCVLLWISWMEIKTKAKMSTSDLSASLVQGDCFCLRSSPLLLMLSLFCRP